MKLFIPEIGDQLHLSKDWWFETVCEHRNISLFDAFDIPQEKRTDKIKVNTYYRYVPKLGDFLIPAGTVLKVDRVYIRKGMEDFSSITFVIVSAPDKRSVKKKDGGEALKAVRFWVRLQETRNIEFEP